MIEGKRKITDSDGNVLHYEYDLTPEQLRYLIDEVGIEPLSITNSAGQPTDSYGNRLSIPGLITVLDNDGNVTGYNDYV